MIMASEPPSALLEGVYVANVTPFLDDDRYTVDPHAYGAHVRWLADHGVAGIVPFGTNGEGPSIASREKRPILEILAATDDLQIIATVAEANLPDTLDQLAFLDDLAVRAVMVMPPYYFKPVETAGLKIFSAADRPRLHLGPGKHRSRASRGTLLAHTSRPRRGSRAAVGSSAEGPCLD
jgi:dihydrodipicolinate synthase/N-acetylneuraminate lyase